MPLLNFPEESEAVESFEDLRHSGRVILVGW